MKVKNIIKIVIMAVLLILVFNPGLFPFGESTVAAIRAQMDTHVASIIGGKTGIFSLSTLFPAIAAVLICWIVATVLDLAVILVTGKNARTRTVVGLTASIIKYACVIVAIVWALSIMGVNLTAIFASLGVLTLIIGFGAQSLIEDMVTGMFIIFEGNYNVDDIIVLDDFRGIVKKIGIRTTTIMDDGGNIKIINNSDIRNIQNRSNHLSLAICDIGITYEADIREVEKIVLPKLEEMYLKNSSIFASVPVYKGVQELADSAVVLRFTVECKESNFFVARRLLNREMKCLFDDNNISIPFPQVDVHAK